MVIVLIRATDSRGQHHFRSRSGRLNHTRKIPPDDRLGSCMDEDLGDERCYGMLGFLVVSEIN